MRKIIFLSLFFLFCFASTNAQDTYFSQFYSAPVKLNPALAGAFNGKYRVSGIYRDQWRSFLEAPISTYSVSTDLRFNVGNRSSAYKDRAGVGIYFVTDRFSEFDYAFNQINVAGAYHKSLSPLNNSYLSLGVQIGMNQKTINFNRLTYSDQFDGEFGYTESTNENLPENNVAFSDMTVGVNFTSNPRRGIAIFTGISIHHVLEPNVSFYENEDPDEEDPYKNYLPRRYSAQANIRFSLSDRFQLMPRAVVDIQGGNMKIDAGLNYRFLLSAFNGTALQFGTYIRTLKDIDSTIGLESVIAMVGLEYNNVLVGFSYDANLSTFQASGARRSAFEISVAYLGDYENELVLCPKF